MMFSLVWLFTSMSVLMKNTTKYQHSEVPQFSGSHIGFIVTIKVIKKRQGFPSKLEFPFSSWAPICIFIQKTSVIISLLGVPDFDGDWLLFEFLISPKKILTFWGPREFLISYTSLFDFSFDETHDEILTFSGPPI